MPSLARESRRVSRSLVAAAAVGLVVSVGSGALTCAHAQSTYGTTRSSVTVDYSVLDRLGPAPRVPDGRFVLRLPAPHGTHVVHVARRHERHPHALAQRAIHHPVHRLARVHPQLHLASIVRDGSVTIDYSALPPRIESTRPRIVLRRPGTATVAAAAPAAARPEAPLTPSAAPPQTAVLTPPAPQPPKSPVPVTPLAPRVATTPNPPEPSAGPRRSDLPELSSLLPVGGVALAATRSPTEPVSDTMAPQSDSRAIRFAPGTADLQGDAPAVLDGVAQKLKSDPNERIALVAYASGDADQAIEARRVSLARAVMVRAYLIQHGVTSTRIDVRALGNRVTDGGSADRVDLVTTGR